MNKIDSAWDPDVMARQEYAVHLSADHQTVLKHLLEQTPAGEAIHDDNAFTAFQDLFDWIDAQIFTGKGLVVINGFPCQQDGFSVDQVRQLYLAFCRNLGKPLIQNQAHDLVYDVRNRFVNMDPKTDSRGPQTSESLQLHTAIGSILGLCCYDSSANGGETLLCPAQRVYDEFAKLRPDLLPELYKIYYGDRRNAQPVHANPYDRSPIFIEHDDVLKCRYVAIYYQAAQEKYPQVPRLSPSQIEALQLMDHISKRDDICLAVDLRPGDIILLNNEQILHGRKAFTNHASRERILFRIWLDKPEINIFEHYFGYV